ncbi:MAG TPA: hypothetical protein VFL64_03345 [Rhizobacter sp.]|nr:hypothetical protein [Rhizobacter sp.]
MAISMQGSWTLRVAGLNAAYAQRFIVRGAERGNGTYDGIIGKAVFVSGRHWSLQVQHRPGRRPWADSLQRIGLPRVEGGLLRFELASNDGGLDNDYDDLVLSCSLPVSQADHVVYGSVTRHVGSGPFNPRRDDYLVIDPPVDLAAVCARHPHLAEVVRKLYPERLRALRGTAGDPTPLVLPSGLPAVSVGLLFESRALRDVACREYDERAMVAALQTTVKRMPFRAVVPKAGLGRLAPRDLDVIAEMREAALRQHCVSEPAPGLMLRFQHYERSADELADGPYVGTGLREDLGAAVTDEQGSYVFRFRREQVAAGRPNVIVQLLSGSGGGRGCAFETAPYDQLANLRRIDLCVPQTQVHSAHPCVDDRVIQRARHVMVAAPDDPLGVRMRQAA